MEEFPKGASGLLLKGPKFIRTTHILYTQIDEVAERVEQRNWEGVQSPWAYATSSLIATATLIIIFGEKVDVGKSASATIVEETVSDPSMLFAWVGFAFVLQFASTRAVTLENTMTAVYAYLYGIGTSAIAVFLLICSLIFSSNFGSPPSPFPVLLFMLAVGPAMLWSFFVVPTAVLAKAYRSSYEFAGGLLFAYLAIIFYFARGA